MAGTAIASTVASGLRRAVGAQRRCISSSWLVSQDRGFKVDLEAIKETDDQPQPTEKKGSKDKAGVLFWKPDPKTGMWVPEDRYGFIAKSSASSLAPQKRIRTWPRASMDERAWWSSLEEVPPERYQPRVS